MNPLFERSVVQGSDSQTILDFVAKREGGGGECSINYKQVLFLPS